MNALGVLLKGLSLSGASRLFLVHKVNGRISRWLFTRVWLSVWLQSGYATSKKEICEHYREYEGRSKDFLVLFLGFFPCGTLRLILGSGNKQDLPVLKDFEHTSLIPEKVGEITLATTLSSFRKAHSLVFLVAIKALFAESLRQGLDGWVIAADKRLWRGLPRLSMPFHQTGPEKMYEGSITVPGFLSVEESLKCFETGEIGSFMLK